MAKTSFSMGLSSHVSKVADTPIGLVQAKLISDMYVSRCASQTYILDNENVHLS